MGDRRGRRRAARHDDAEYDELAKTAYATVRTGETRTYGNALLRKGVVGHPSA